ncbi:MAG TPA: insulinase family protein, partial [Caldimonas sp.]|nr:insulinase family protein [Caldimonas sp.]
MGDSQLVGAMYHTVPQASPDYVALDALTEIMTVAPAGRLYRSLVDTKLSSAVEGDNWGMKDPGVAMFFAHVSGEDSLGKARDALLATLEGVKSHPITDAEMERVKARAQNEYDRVLANPQQFASALSEAMASGDWRLFFIERDRWRNVKAADVQRVAEAYIKPSNRTLGEFIPDAKPDRAPMQASVDVAALVKNYHGDAPIAAGEAFDPTPANLDARTQRFTLANGMKVALLPKKTRGGTVQFVLQMHHGDERALLGKDVEASLAASLLQRGTAKKSRQEIQDALDLDRARISISGDATRTDLRGHTVREKLADTLALMAEVLREPSFPAEEFAKLQRERTTDVEGRRSDPEDVASRALARYENPYPEGDVRYMPTVDEEVKLIESTKLDAVTDFYKRFAGGSYAELSVVGDFDPAAVRSEVEKLFGDWRTAAPFTRLPNPLVMRRAMEIR